MAWLVACLVAGLGCDSPTRDGNASVQQARDNDSSAENPGDSESISIAAAAQALKAGDFAAAEHLSRQILIADPADLDAGLMLVNLLQRRSDLQGAAELLLQLAESPSENQHLLQAQAAEFLEQDGQAQRGIRILTEIIERQPDQLEIRRRLALMLNDQGYRFDANEHLRYLAGRATLTTRELIALINPLLTWTSFSEKPDLRNHEAVRRAGRLNVVAALRANGEVRDALTLLQSDPTSPPHDHASNAMRGWLLALHQDDQGLKQWAVTIDPAAERYPAYWLAMGHLMLRQEQASASDCFREALRRESAAVEALDGLAQALTAQGHPQWTTAIRDRQRAINETQALAQQIGNATQVNPELGNPLLVSEIGRVLSKIGRPIESLAWQESVYSMLDPDAPQIALLRAHKQKVLAQLPSGSDVTLTAFENTIPQMGTFAADLAKLRLESDDLQMHPIAGQPPSDDAVVTPPVFTNVAKELGIVIRHYNADPPVEKEFRLFEALGSGVACLDVDRDGNVDLYFGQAGGRPPLEPSVHSNRLMLNHIERFIDRTAESNAGDLGYTHGVTSGDWNQDGWSDLIVANVGVNRLLINQGDGTFRDASLALVQMSEPWQQPQVTTSIAMADVTGDALPDIVEANYVDDARVYHAIERRADGSPVMLPGPKHFNAAPARLFVTTPDGQLRWESLGPADRFASTGLGVLVTDIDGDQQNEILIANDQNPNHLWKRRKIEPQGPDPHGAEQANHWSEIAVLSGCAFGSGGKPFACMGIAAADFDRSGTLDLHLTNFSGECSNLYLQNESGAFTDRAIAYQLDQPTVAMVGFGTQAIDYDNNSTIDLVIGNGHIEDFRSQGKPFHMPTQILAGRANRFDVQKVLGDDLYWQTPHLARGVAILDWNRDGRVDIAITDLKEEFVLLENRTETTGHFLQLELVGSRSERDAIGARVEVRYGDRWSIAVVQAGDGYLCRNESVLNFGLGAAVKNIDQVTIHWPSGEVQQLDQVPIDTRVMLIEGQQDSWLRSR